MSEVKTNVMRILERQKIAYNHYCYEGTGAVSGIEVAAALGEDADRVFKTLVTVSRSRRYYVFMIPVAAELNLKKAAAAILICGDLERAFPPAKDYWIIDGAIAVQNMTLCADALGLGSVWLGTWPQMDRVEKQAALFNLPETIVPHSALALGYPAKENKEPRESRYEENRVHFEKW